MLGNNPPLCTMDGFEGIQRLRSTKLRSMKDLMISKKKREMT